MGTIVCVYAVGISDYALEETTPFGDVPIATVIDKARELPEVERGVLITDREPELFSDFWPMVFGPIVSRTFGGLIDVIETLRDEMESQRDENGAGKEKGSSADHLFFLWGDTPLIDVDLARRMFERHVKYFASYTFADGYPLGLAPEIVRKETLPQLHELAERHEIPLGRSMLFDLIQKDINAFDLETEVSPKDMRLHRALLAADTRRNLGVLNGVIERGGREAESVIRVVDEEQEVLRTLPAYLHVQVSEGCPQACAYCPYPRLAEEGRTVSGNAADVRSLDAAMSVERWRSLMRDAQRFCDDLVVGIGLWGEPALHPQIVELVESALAYPNFRVVIETSGVGWSADALSQIARFDTSRIDWIVSLDAAERATYERLRGPQWEEAQAAVSMLREHYGDDKVHVQAVRVGENEAELERFYRSWKKEGLPLIVQKYDHFCGYLPERKVTDLSPLTRFACYHLRRDLPVLLDGTVSMCREDLAGDYHVGNVFDEGVETVWERMAPYYRRHLSGELPALCENCDEYYTYNF